MKVDFVAVTLRNFKSFRGSHRFPIMSGPGLYFLKGRNEAQRRLGSNGSGKSSILDAMSWCLFGRTISDLRNPDIKPWVGERETSVSVRMLIDNKKHDVERTTYPNRLLIGGTEAGQDDVERLIGMSHDLFRHTIVLGQGRPLFFDLSPAGKMQLFSDVLALDKWDMRAAYASKRVSSYDSDIAYKQGELTRFDESIAQLKRMRDKTQVASDEWVKTHDEIMKTGQKELKDAETKCKSVTGSYDKASGAYDECSMELDELQKQVLKRRKIYELAQERRQERLNQLSLYCTDVERLERAIAEMKKSKVCPTCGQPIKHKKGVHDRSPLLEIELKQARKLAAGKVSAELTTAFNNAKQSYEQCQKDEESFAEKLQKLSGELDYWRKPKAELEAKVEALRKAIATADKMENPHTQTLLDLKKQTRSLIAKRDETKSELSVLSKRRERAALWVKGFKDVRLYVIDELRQELEIAINASLEENGLLGWSVKLDVEKETAKGTVQRGFNVSIISPTSKEPARWESWSGGEGQRLRLVGALALSEVLLNHAGIECNMEVLDEPTQHLSPEGVRDLTEWLGERARLQKRVTYYADHQSAPSSRFTGTITVVNEPKSGSRIEVV